MAGSVFLDTVGLIALLNSDDEYHKNASEVFHQIGRAGRNVVTTSLVLAEVGNGLARTGPFVPSSLTGEPRLMAARHRNVVEY